MLGHDIVTIGASAGGIPALTRLSRDLPEDLAASVFVVLHLPSDGVSVVPEILNRAGPLPAGHAADGERIRQARMYVAPPDRQMLLKEGFLRVIEGPRENRHRPAIDPLFRTAARIYGPRVIGVLLSGSSDDGVAGLRAIKNRGGLVVVQDPADAIQSELPQNAVDFVEVDRIVPIAEMAAVLADLIQQPASAQPMFVSPQLQKEALIAELDLETIEDENKVGKPSVFSCPDCGGVLWELEDGDMLRFRCRVGHAYTGMTLAGEQRDSSERALWAAFRTLEESASFARRMSVRARRAGHMQVAARYLARAEEAAANAAAVREMIVHIGSHASELISERDDPRVG